MAIVFLFVCSLVTTTSFDKYLKISHFYLQNEQLFRLQGYEQFIWKKRKMWDHFKSRSKEFIHKMELWKNSMRNIEGNFGTGVVAFFFFLKWLFLLNLVIFLIILLFITLPSILLVQEEQIDLNIETNKSDIVNHEKRRSISGNNIIMDIIQGTGLLSTTPFFYGYYSNETLSNQSGDFTFYYNIPLAYVLITILYFLLSLFAILRSSVKGFTERLVEGEGQFYKYCNLLFGGWDFCIDNQKASQMKHKAIYSEMKVALEIEKIHEEKKSRSKKEVYNMYFVRFLINILVIIVLLSCAYLIYLVFKMSTDAVSKSQASKKEQWDELFYEYLPSMTIVGFNIIIPFLFRYLISFEKYSPVVVIRFTLIRTVFLRLASLVVLYFSLLTKINCTNLMTCETFDCWETFVGQQIYKLVLTDFATQIILTFFVNFPRAILAKHVKNKCVKFIGEQTFDLPKHALDVVYVQTLCWFGIFFAPIISLFAPIIMFLLFYVKKFACLVNSKPSPTIYRASRSNSMFMFVLLVSFVFAVLPIAYSFSELIPSKKCGPFRSKKYIWSLIVELFEQAPIIFQNSVFFVSSSGFAIPCFIIILFFLYYYGAVSAANRHMVSVLKNQLVLEGHDKQFLLDRLSLFIKQESQKRIRSEHTTIDDRNN